MSSAELSPKSEEESEDFADIGSLEEEEDLPFEDEDDQEWMPELIDSEVKIQYPMTDTFDYSLTIPPILNTSEEVPVFSDYFDTPFHSLLLGVCPVGSNSTVARAFIACHNIKTPFSISATLESPDTHSKISIISADLTPESPVATFKEPLFVFDQIPTAEFSLNLSIHYLVDPNSTRKFFNAVGLINDGMTCYLNSLIQSLFAIKGFRQIVYSIPPHQCDIADGLCIVFIFMQLSKGPVSTRPLTKAFEWKAEDFYTQHDVQELMRLLFDRIDNHCGNQASKLFKGKHKVTIKCESPVYEASHEEEFDDLSLNVKGIANIEDSLKAFYTPDKLNGSEQYHLPDGTKCDAEMSTSIISTPTVLCLHLRRFEYANLQMQKISTQFVFGTQLEFGGSKYNLSSIISHLGSVYGGHYCSFAKVGEEKWLQFDDDDVIPLTEKEVLEENYGGNKGFTAYVLFYIKEGEKFEEPVVPAGILEAEKEKRSKKIVTVFAPDWARNEIEVDRKISVQEMQQKVSELLKIELSEVILRKYEKQGIVGETIEDMNGVTQLYVDKSPNVPFNAYLFVPGHQLFFLGLRHAVKGTTAEEVCGSICSWLGIDTTPLDVFKDVCDEVFTQYTGTIDSFTTLYFQFRESGEQFIEKVISTFNIKPLELSENSHIFILKKRINTFQDYIENVGFSTEISFIEYGNSAVVHKITLAACSPFKDVLTCLGSVLGCEPNHIFLFKSLSYLSRPEFSPVDSSICPTIESLKGQSRQIFYEEANDDVSLLERFDITVIDSNFMQTKRLSVCQYRGNVTLDKLKAEVSSAIPEPHLMYYIREGFPRLFEDTPPRSSHRVVVQLGDFQGDYKLVPVVLTANTVPGEESIPFFLKADKNELVSNLAKPFKWAKKATLSKLEKRNAVPVVVPDGGKIGDFPDTFLLIEPHIDLSLFLPAAAPLHMKK